MSDCISVVKVVCFRKFRFSVSVLLFFQLQFHKFMDSDRLGSSSCILSVKHSQNHDFKELAIGTKYFLPLHSDGSQNYSCFPSTTRLAQWTK